MARKKNLYDSKSAETCPCGCCKWHSNRAISMLLAAMFILIVIAFAASLVFSYNTYYSSSILAFMGVIFLIVFAGWGVGFFCSCRGYHWGRHGYGMPDHARHELRRRYASGEITKKQFDKMMRDLE